MRKGECYPASDGCCRRPWRSALSRGGIGGWADLGRSGVLSPRQGPGGTNRSTRRRVRGSRCNHHARTVCGRLIRSVGTRPRRSPTTRCSTSNAGPLPWAEPMRRLQPARSRTAATGAAYVSVMSDFWNDGQDQGSGGSGGSGDRRGKHCDACNEWLDGSDTHCPSCGSSS